MSMTIRNPDIRSEFDKYLTQRKQYFGTDTELACIYQSYCFVLELQQHLETPGKPEQHYGTNIHIGFHSSQLSVGT